MFASENDVVNGLQKVVAVEGYKGVFKSKTVFFLFNIFIEID
jgi:hypothetical protein